MNNSSNLVSIGLPVYNGENFLESTLKSILNQTFTNIEIIISDNASTDKTEEICRAYSDADNRIKYFRNEKNLGAAKNYNLVFKYAKGKYFKWAAHDDNFDPTFIEKCVILLDGSDEIILCYSRMLFIDENGTELERISDELFFNESDPSDRYGKFLKKFRRTTKYCDPIFGVIRSDYLRKTKLIGNYPTSDMNLLAELILLGKFYELDEYLFFRRRHANMSAKAHASNYNRAIWFDPANKGRILLTRWRWLFEFLSSVRRVPMSIKSKIKCYWETTVWAVFRLRGLLGDLLLAGRYLLFKGSARH